MVMVSMAKSAVAFHLRGQGEKGVEGLVARRAVPAPKEEPLVAAMEDFRNVQRPADVGPKPRLIVVGLRRRNACHREWPRVQSGVVIHIVEDSVGLIDVEAARHSAESDQLALAAAGSATAARRAKGSSTFPLHAIFKFLNVLLDFFFVAQDRKSTRLNSSN